MSPRARLPDRSARPPGAQESQGTPASVRSSRALDTRKRVGVAPRGAVTGRSMRPFCYRTPGGAPGGAAGTPRAGLDLVALQELLADDHALDLGRALADEQQRRVAVQALDLVLLGVAVAA